MKRRGMSEQQALQRIHSQPPQELKIAAASVVIQNDGSFENTWKQVVAAWKVISPTTDTAPLITSHAGPGELAVQRGRPRDSANIAALITRLSGGTRSLSSDDIMAAFSDKAFLLLTSNKNLVGLAGWQVENLVSRTTELYLDPVITTRPGSKNAGDRSRRRFAGFAMRSFPAFFASRFGKAGGCLEGVGLHPSHA